jgi:hypothetical protein
VAPPEAIGGYGGGLSVPITRCCAGSATAPASSWWDAVAWRPHKATWTAQSARPSSAYSRLPSSGSTIHTRSAESRSGVLFRPAPLIRTRESVSSSERTASAGRQRASSVRRSSWDSLSPAALIAAGSANPASARTRTSNSPAAAASQRANAPSVTGGVIILPRSVGASGAPDRGDGAREDHQVERERPVLHAPVGAYRAAEIGDQPVMSELANQAPWYAFCAHSTPLVTTASVTSAARSTRNSSSLRSAEEKSDST